MSLPARKGVVSVSLVESVQHQPQAQPQARAKVKSMEKAPVPEKSEQTAQQQPTQGQPGEAGDPKAVARESDLLIGAVTQLINSHKIYPQEAIDREEEGKVTLGLTLDRAGQLLDLKVEEPSPFELLNQAALLTVRAVKQFPRLPEVVPAPLHLHVPLIFRIEKN